MTWVCLVVVHDIGCQLSLRSFIEMEALRNDQNLARFVVEGRATGRQLGTGSYGSVEEVAIGLKLYYGSTKRLNCRLIL